MTPSTSRSEPSAVPGGDGPRAVRRPRSGREWAEPKRPRWALSIGLIALLSITGAPHRVAEAGTVKKVDQRRAAEIAMQAVKLYRERKYQEAALMFLQAYDISKRPAQVRNAAKAYEEGELLDEALQLWTQYRDHEGINDDERGEAIAHLQLIDEKKKNREIVQKAQEAAVVAAREEVERREKARAEELTARPVEARSAVETDGGGPPIASVVLMGAGGAAIAAGGVVWLLAAGRLDDLDGKLANQNAEGLIIGTTPAEVDSEVSGINTSRVISGVLVSAGAVALGTGVLWLLLADDAPRSASAGSIARPFVVLAPGGGAVGLEGRF